MAHLLRENDKLVYNVDVHSVHYEATWAFTDYCYSENSDDLLQNFPKFS